MEQFMEAILSLFVLGIKAVGILFAVVFGAYLFGWFQMSAWLRVFGKFPDKKGETEEQKYNKWFTNLNSKNDEKKEV